MYTKLKLFSGAYTEFFSPYLAVAGPHSGGYRDILIDGFVPSSTNVAPMFPFYENTFEWDDFGEVINPDDYVIKVEDMDQTGMHVSSICEICSPFVAVKFNTE